MCSLAPQDTAAEFRRQLFGGARPVEPVDETPAVDHAEPAKFGGARHLAQAQHTLRQLVDLLIERGVQVDYAIHPVAGRMPGHMNVLLAEAQVPYEQLKEMDEIDPEFKQADVALVVGANDVVNPAAETTPGAPIYGMPILHANQARQVVFMKRSMRPGFAGIENELLYEPTTTLLFGDAKDTMGKLLAELKALTV